MLATEPHELLDNRGKSFRVRELYLTDATETVVMVTMKVTDQLVFPFEQLINLPIGITNVAYR